MSWRDSAQPDVPKMGLGDLQEGQVFVVAFQDDGAVVETKHGDALQVTVEVLEAPEGYVDMGGEEIEEGETYALMTSSSRLKFALANFADPLTGEQAEISVVEGATDFDRQYLVN